MKLNVRAQTAQNQHNNSSIILVHGLSGSPDSLGVLARDLVGDHNIVQVDMRNHDLSPRGPVMNYPAIAQGLVDTLDVLQADRTAFIGHSVDGKAVVILTTLAPNRIDKLVAVGIAPIGYHVYRHDEIFVTTDVVSESDVQTRQQVTTVMRQHLNEGGVIQLLLEPFVGGEWYFNAPVLWDQYPYIVGWKETPAQNHPILLIPGNNSPYISEQYHDDLLAQFPQVRAHVIAGTGHWIHAEESDAVLRTIHRYLND